MWRDWRSYWRAYGGLPALLTSPFFWLALLFTALSSPWWTADHKWPDTALLILPPLLGFTIGAMAVVLAFPTSKIFKHLAEDGRADSYYAQLAAKLVHFILIQTIGIMCCLWDKSVCSYTVDAIGVFFLLYATLTAIAIAFALFNMAMLYNEAAGLMDENSK